MKVSMHLHAFQCVIERRLVGKVSKTVLHPQLDLRREAFLRLLQVLLAGSRVGLDRRRRLAQLLIVLRAKMCGPTFPSPIAVSGS